MSAIKVVHENGRTVITRRQNLCAWLLASPYIFYECFVIAVSCTALYRALTIMQQHKPVPALVLVGGTLFALKAWFLARWLYGMLIASSILTVRGDSLEIQCGTLLRLENLGTYTATSMTNLEVERGNSLFPNGRVKVQVAGVSLILTKYISDGDGNCLIDKLCDAYPFNTPAPTQSPAVVRW